MAKIALLIGISEYGFGLNLPAAANDVEAMRRVLAHPEMCGFAEADILVLKNPERQTMEEGIEQLFVSRQKDDLVLLYISGHAVKDDIGRLYLATSGTRKTARGDLIRSSAVSVSFLHEMMSSSRSRRQVLILDCSFSGAFAEGLVAKDDGLVDVRSQLGGESRVVLTSSTSIQYSFEQEGSQLSIYTNYLVEGIETGAADRDDDGFIAVDELHEYASRKCQEAAPRMKPEIYAVREGYKIILAKASTDVPKLKYRKEVERLVNQDGFSPISRSLLDILRQNLRLKLEEAQTIEDEVLAPYQQRLQQYEQVFTETIQFEYPISDASLEELKRFQQILGLRDKDVALLIQKNLLTQSQIQKLQQYEEVFTSVVQREYPLTPDTRNELKRLQQVLELAEEEVASIEKRITTPLEAEYQKKLQQYEQEFSEVIQRQYPLRSQSREKLECFQQELRLREEDVAIIKAKIEAKINSADIKEIRLAIDRKIIKDYQRLAKAIIRRMGATSPLMIASLHFESSNVWEALLPSIGLRVRNEKAIIYLRQKEESNIFHENLAEIAFEKNAVFLIVVDIVDIRRPPMQVGPPTIWFRPESLIEMATMPENELLGWLGRFITTQIDVCSLPGLLPYQTTGAAREEIFFGRDYELTRLIGGILRGGIIVGAHRSGKTSLLYQLAKRLQQQGHQVVTVLTLGGIDNFKSFFERTLDSLNIDFSSEMTPASWAGTLRNYTKNNQKVPIFLLDEVDELISLDIQSAFQLGRQMRSLQSDGHCKFFLAGHAKLRAAVEVEGGPFRNFAEEITLTGLTETASMRLIQQPMKLIGFEVTDKQANRICKGTAGVAVLIQEFCVQLLRGLRQVNASRIEDSEIEKIEQSPEYLNIVFEHYKYAQEWDSMVVLLLTNIFREAKKREILEEMNKLGASLKFSRLDKILNFLVRFGILEEFKPTEYRILPTYLQYTIISRDPESLINSILNELNDNEFNEYKMIVTHKKYNNLEKFLNIFKDIFIN